VLVIGGVALTIATGGGFAAFVLGGAISGFGMGFGLTGAVTNDFSAALQAGAIGAVAGAAGGAASYGAMALVAGAAGFGGASTSAVALAGRFGGIGMQMLMGGAGGVAGGFAGGVASGTFTGLSQGKSWGESLHMGWDEGVTGAAFGGALGMGLPLAGAAWKGLGRASNARIQEGTMDAIAGIPESKIPLPPSAAAGQGLKWSRAIRFAGTNPLTGEISFNPAAWNRATMGQRATMFWEEAAHSARILSRPMWMRKINWFLYKNVGLARAIEESMARYQALGSGFNGRFAHSIRYGLNYKGMNPMVPITQAGLLAGGAFATGYLLGDALFND
jgi:hypothetical protein